MRVTVDVEVLGDGDRASKLEAQLRALSDAVLGFDFMGDVPFAVLCEEARRARALLQGEEEGEERSR